MSATHELMDLVKSRNNLRSDIALGRLLGVGQSTVSNWRQGTRHPQPHYIDAMAKAISEQPIQWALRIQAERDALIDPTNAKVWLRWANSFGKSAAAVILTFGLAVYTPKSHADQAVQNFAKSSNYVYYVQLRNRLRKAFNALLDMLVGPRQGTPRGHELMAA